MKNFDYEKKYHYILKYLILGFPLIVLLVYLFTTYNVSDLNSGIDTLSNFTDSFMSWEYNHWYDSLLETLHITYTDNLVNVLIHLPVYFLYVYIFDIIFDVVSLLPKLCHNLIKKVTGGY